MDFCNGVILLKQCFLQKFVGSVETVCFTVVIFMVELDAGHSICFYMLGKLVTRIVDPTKGKSMLATIIKMVWSAYIIFIWIERILGFIPLKPRLKKLYYSKHQRGRPR